MPNGHTTDERIVALEVSVKDIKDNHLHTIEKKIDRLTWFWITTLLAVALTAIFT